ncbi:MAG: hypothetical protein ACLFRG_18520 [Desulfococcaceae bacterium]
MLNEPMGDICRKTAQAKVGDFVKWLSQGECVEENANINKAIHRFVLGNHPSPPATRN